MTPQMPSEQRREVNPRGKYTELAAPARATLTAGSTGYAGYEYQISVTIWVALDLLLAKAITDVIIIEPPSHEDIEVAVHDPDSSLLGLTVDSDRLRLIFQAKRRSGAPWSSAALANVLTGTNPPKGANACARPRPLEILSADQRARYVFVTNEAVTRSLRRYEAQDIFDTPEASELPGKARPGYDPSTRAELARRILLFTGLTAEVLDARIRRLLTRHGHVASVQHEKCLSDLRHHVRRRILGDAEGRLTSAELLAAIARHGGSVAPTRALDHYVRPRSFDRIWTTLKQFHAVLIVGPSGTGKTLTAEMLETELRQSYPPFDVVGEEHGPAHVRQHLMRPDPVLFHLRDPWGGNRLTPGADRWSGELPKLLASASEGKKFIITSRSDVLDSAGGANMNDLRRFTVTIEIEDYGPERLQSIYDRIASGLTGHAGSLAQAFREAAVRSLDRPYEIDRFLVALSHEDPREPRTARDIVADSQISAISRVLALQLQSSGDDGVASAAIIWALLAGRGAVARDVVPTVLRRIRSLDSTIRPDAVGLVDFLVAGRNLRQDGVGISFYHPKVEDGLRLTFMRNPSETEHVLSVMLAALTAMDPKGEDWGIETALRALRATAGLQEIQLTLSLPTQERIDAYLESNALSANRHFDYERALDDLASFGGPNHLPSRLARVLVGVGPQSEQITSLVRDPPELTDRAIDDLRNYARTPQLIDRFVRHVLPFTHTDHHHSISSLIVQIVPGVESAFWEALNTVARLSGSSQNIEAIVAGACSGPSADYDQAIASFANSFAEADAWMDREHPEIRRAEEHEVDAMEAEHILERPADRYYNAQTGMQAVVALRHPREGLSWIVVHPQRQYLISAAAQLCRQNELTPSIEDLRLLLRFAEGWTRAGVWAAVQQHWQADLVDLLRMELCKTDLYRDLRRCLLKIAALNRDDDSAPFHLLGEVVQQVSPERQLELVQDVVRAALSHDYPEVGAEAAKAHAQRLSDGLSEPLAELGRLLAAIMAGDEIKASAQSLSAAARTQLSRLLISLPAHVAAPLICAGSAIGLNTIPTVTRLLATGDPDHGVAAIQALQIDGHPRVKPLLKKALKHCRDSVRREALRVLVATEDLHRRRYLLATAADRSAEVRLAFAGLMQDHRWPEAIDALLKLLSDGRNFSVDYGLGGQPWWPEFKVARAAAHALGAYDSLSLTAVERLCEVAEERSPDPFVACAAISALADHDGERIPKVIFAALEGPGLEASPPHRPRAQAAAWAILHRVAVGKVGNLARALSL